MKRFQFSLNSALAAVAIAAIDCVALRSIHSRPFPLTADIALVVVSVLPMANLLTIGALLLLRQTRKRSPFLLGFELCGALALFAFVGLTIWQPDRVVSCATPILEFLDENVDDSEPSAFAPTGPKGRGPVGDLRSVRITLLGGAGAGAQETLPRCFLRPVR